MFTVVMMNLIDFIINVGVIIYGITIKPIYFLFKFLFSGFMYFAFDLQLFIVIGVFIVSSVKIYEYLSNNEKLENIIPFIISIILLIISVIINLLKK